MTHYNKGANAERELIKELFRAGFAVTRVAGSGVNPLPCPDVIALKKGRIIAFECKAWKGNHLAIPHINMAEEVGWAETAGAEFFIAWKVPNAGWLFVRADAFHKAGKNYMISLHEAKLKGVDLGVILGSQSQLKLVKG
ncbi:MAG: Holliday junction resolvase Hjc [archaeon]|jgi:Holliday junction resolvase